MNDLLARLQLDAGLTRQILVNFIHDEITRVGLARAIVGLSGGIDSALVAALAVRALGRENVLGVLMPYRTSNPDSRLDAELMVEQLGIPHKLIEITPMVDAYFAALDGQDQAGPQLGMRKGNVMARQRMIVLYDQSAAFGGLVVGTANKTEALLGYTTQFGDAAAALHPISDLYKCQVRQLAAALDVPERVRAKAPSADLWAGQTDEGELGFSYDEADQILYLLVDERRRPDEVIAQGFRAAVVNEVVRRIRRNQYKRVPPLIAKVSPRTIGIDFLYLRDWGT